jgi:hypothetical protein
LNLAHELVGARADLKSEPPPVVTVVGRLRRAGTEKHGSLDVRLHLEDFKDVRVERVSDWLARLSRHEQQQIGFGQVGQPVIGPCRPQALTPLSARGFLLGRLSNAGATSRTTIPEGAAVRKPSPCRSSTTSTRKSQIQREQDDCRLWSAC